MGQEADIGDLPQIDAKEAVCETRRPGCGPLRQNLGCPGALENATLASGDGLGRVICGQTAKLLRVNEFGDAWVVVAYRAIRLNEKRRLTQTR